MVINRRREEKIDLPDHFEGVVLKGPLRLGTWILGTAITGLGIGLMVVAEGTLYEAVGAVCAACGCIGLTALIRCRRFETAVGKRWLTAGAGPLNQKVPVDMIDGIEIHPASSWRRFYADREVVMELRTGHRRLIVPSLQPDETANAVRRAAGQPKVGTATQET